MRWKPAQTGRPHSASPGESPTYNLPERWWDRPKQLSRQRHHLSAVTQGAIAAATQSLDQTVLPYALTVLVLARLDTQTEEIARALAASVFPSTKFAVTWL